MIGREVEERAIDSEEPTASEETSPEVEETDGPDGPNGSGGAGQGVRVLELGVLLVAVLLLAWGTVSWVRASGHDDAEVARAELRDTVLITARSHIETLNTLDGRDVEGGLKKWESISTGTFKDQIAATPPETYELLSDQGKASTAKVIDAAVAALEDDTATVIASVVVTVADAEDPTVKPTEKRNRFVADLTKVNGTWLIEALEQLPVDIS